MSGRGASPLRSTPETVVTAFLADNTTHTFLVGGVMRIFDGGPGSKDLWSPESVVRPATVDHRKRPCTHVGALWSQNRGGCFVKSVRGGRTHVRGYLRFRRWSPLIRDVSVFLRAPSRFTKLVVESPSIASREAVRDTFRS